MERYFCALKSWWVWRPRNIQKDPTNIYAAQEQKYLPSQQGLQGTVHLTPYPCSTVRGKASRISKKKSTNSFEAIRLVTFHSQWGCSFWIQVMMTTQYQQASTAIMDWFIKLRITHSVDEYERYHRKTRCSMLSCLSQKHPPKLNKNIQKSSKIMMFHLTYRWCTSLVIVALTTADHPKTAGLQLLPSSGHTQGCRAVPGTDLSSASILGRLKTYFLTINPYKASCVV